MVRYLKYVARIIGVKAIYTHLQNAILKWRGYRLLSIEQTNAFMAAYAVQAIEGTRFELPRVVNCADTDVVIFETNKSRSDKVHVWDYTAPRGKDIHLSKYGSVIVQNRVLCTDWNYNSFYKDIWRADTREKKAVTTVIALFSQFTDGVFYGGYYDFVFLVLAKLCRIMEAFPNEDFSHTLISYPLFNAPYETDYLQLLNINTANLYDSVKYNVVSQRVLTGNSAHWYPNLDDILCLKRLVQKQFKPVETAPKRVYICRSGRRRIINEAELITMLKKFDFVIIDDSNRSVSDQISIYYNASFILGPHGASFSNVIWCKPGTHLFELFSPNYAPDFFLYLATLMSMEYSAFYEGVPDNKIDYLDGLVEDIYIPVAKLETCLENIFKADIAL
ncbi:glycosyltransferase family 61 protein [Mucilaginibacter calamicampi]|uniref:Glycosyltransferase family 61 protein n=1 Tax=Mucilaginibacter calamicampi TaxID=1302352 RepID=A0ABW2YX66_9SPHI